MYPNAGTLVFLKRKDMIRKLKKAGWSFVREGGKHTVYGKGEQTVAVPRHNEINEITAKKILEKATE